MREMRHGDRFRVPSSQLPPEEEEMSVTAVKNRNPVQLITAGRGRNVNRGGKKFKNSLTNYGRKWRVIHPGRKLLRCNGIRNLSRVPLYGYCISQQIFEDLVFYCAGVCLADLLPQRQDGSRGNGQLVDPDGKEGLGQFQIGT